MLSTDFIAECADRSPLDFESHGLVSLWEIMRYQGWRIVAVVEFLRELKDLSTFRINSGLRDSLVSIADLNDLVWGRFNWCRDECRFLELTDTCDRLNNQTLVKMRDGITYAELQTEAMVLRDSITNQLRKRSFAFVPADKAKFQYELEKNWGTIWGKFRKAENDIKEGVECYCLERNTAAVFHFMRVAEHGMRAPA